MIYLDTNVIISVMDERDPNYTIAKEFVMKKIKEKKVISQLTKVELSSVYARGGINDPQAFAIYSIKKIGAELIKADFDQVFLEAFKLSSKIKLRTLDLLHISICKIYNINKFLTFDKNIISKQEILEEIGIKLITPD